MHCHNFTSSDIYLFECHNMIMKTQSKILRRGLRSGFQVTRSLTKRRRHAPSHQNENFHESNNFWPWCTLSPFRVFGGRLPNAPLPKPQFVRLVDREKATKTRPKPGCGKVRVPVKMPCGSIPSGSGEWPTLLFHFRNGQQRIHFITCRCTWFTPMSFVVQYTHLTLSELAIDRLIMFCCLDKPSTVSHARRSGFLCAVFDSCLNAVGSRWTTLKTKSQHEAA